VAFFATQSDDRQQLREKPLLLGRLGFTAL